MLVRRWPGENGAASTDLKEVLGADRPALGEWCQLGRPVRGEYLHGGSATVVVDENAVSGVIPRSA